MGLARGLRALFGGILLCSAAASADEVLRFSHLTQADGLPVNAVRTIYQDREGFLWIGTHEGLSRYDGYSFRNFRADARTPGSLSDNIVTRLIEDRAGTLWVGSFNGLNRYDRGLERFVRVDHGHSGPDRVYALADDGAGGLWIGCDQGLSHRRADGQVETYQTREDDPQSIGPGEVRALVSVPGGGVWVGLYGGGVDYYEPVSRRFQHHRAAAGGLPEDRVSALALQGRTLWVGTRTLGVAGLDLGTGQWQRHGPDPKTPGALGDGAITQLYVDSQQRLWVATFEGGLYRYQPDRQRFLAFRHDATDLTSLSHDTVRGVFEDASGVIWVATRQGLDRYDTYGERFRWFHHQPGNAHTLSHNTISAIRETRDGAIWVGTQPGGLNRVDPVSGDVRHYRFRADDPDSLADDQVWSLYEDRAGRLWVGTAAGLNRYRPETGDFQRYVAHEGDPASPPGGIVQWITEDGQARLWLSTDGGLVRFEPESGRFLTLSHDPARPDSLASDNVGEAYADENGTLWVVYDGEVDAIDTATLAIRHLRPKNLAEIGPNTEIGYLAADGSGGFWLTSTQGLKHLDPASGVLHGVSDIPDITLYGILVDDAGDLWLSSNDGLLRYNPKTRRLRHYYGYDGLQGDEFNAGAFARGRDGTLYFGGTNGFSAFRPEAVTDHAHIPPVVFTDLRLYNRKVAIGSRLLTRALNETRQLTLDYRDDVVAIGFAGLDSAHPDANRYAYRLLGLQDDWIETDARERSAVYTDLSPGDYVFEVKAGNKHGLWNPEPRKLVISVEPPPWRTPWAYAFYALAVLGGLFALWQRQQQKLREERLQARRLRVAVDERTRELRERGRAMRTLLDNAGQGFLAFGPDLRISPEYSQECERLLGSTLAGACFPERLFPDQPEQAEFVASVLRDVLAESDGERQSLYLSLLPEEIHLGERIFRLAVRPLNGRCMAVLTDISTQRALESQVETERNHLRRVLKAVLDPRSLGQIAAEFTGFCEQGLAETLLHAPDGSYARRELLRRVHTFKGCFAQLEFTATAKGLAELEESLALTAPTVTIEVLESLFDLPQLEACLARDRAVLVDYLGPDFLERQAQPRLAPGVLDILEADVRRLLPEGEARAVVLLLQRLRLVPFSELLAGYPVLVGELARRCGKYLSPLVIDGDECLVSPERYGRFARSLVHVFRNLVDHGIEDPETRLVQGKPMAGELRCHLVDTGRAIDLVLSDDGAGIDVAAVRERAIASGLLNPDVAPMLTDAQVWELVFADGLSTRVDVSDLSGRGVGLAAVKAEVELLGGRVRVASIPGRGTSFLFSLPKEG